MRAPVVSRTSKLSLAALAFLLACTLAQPATADERQDRPSTEGLGLSGASIAADDAPMLASLMASGGGHISTAVALEDDPEPVVGSFTVDGLTYAIVGEGEVALVSVDSDVAALAAGFDGAGTGLLADSPDAPSGEDSGSGVPTSPSPSPEGASFDGLGGEDASDSVALEAPAFVEYDGVAYAVVAIGLRSFAGCDADTVVVPAAIGSVDELAFRGSVVKAIEVAGGNPSFSSYDGMLFDAEMKSLLLIPEGKQGAARIPSTAETVPPDAFSHCASVTSVTVDAGSAAFSSRNGCLYDAAGETLLRVPAGATEVEIADGCTMVAAGALEGCVELRSIQAPASVAEVSPEVLGAGKDDYGAPVASICPSGQPADGGIVHGSSVNDADISEDGLTAMSQTFPDGKGGEPVAEAEVSADDRGSEPVQLTSLVALATSGDDLPKLELASITVYISQGADPAPWEAAGFKVEVIPTDASDAAESIEGEPLDDLAAEEAHDLEPNAPSDRPVIVDEVAVGYGYANERSSADGAYERAIPKVDAVLKLQPITAEEPMGGEAAAEESYSSADGAAAEGGATLASKLADLPEDSQAMASFLYEGCLYVIDPEGGAALVAVDPKRLAECVEDPTTLILPDYVDDGTWSYPLTRIAKGALAGSGIERLWIPASATYLDYALEGCETLRYVEISEGSPVYSSKGGCLYDKSGETLWMVPEGQIDKEGQESPESLSSNEKRLQSIQRAETSDPSDSCSPQTRFRSYEGGAVTLSATIFIPANSEATHGTTNTNVGNPKYPIACTHRAMGSWLWSTSVTATGYPSATLYANFGPGVGRSEGDAEIALSYGTTEWAGGSSYKYKWSGWGSGYVSTSPGGPPWGMQTVTSSTSVSLYLHCTQTATPVTVQWAPNGGSGGGTASVLPGSAAAAPAATRSGYTLAGWYTDPAGGSYVCGAGGSVTVTSDVTYYAHWTPNTYTVNYHNRAGTYLGGGAVSYDQWFNLWGNPGGTPGYTPVGWAWAPWQSTAAYGLGAGASNLATGGTVNLYLAEVPNTYTVTYHARSGTRLGSDTFTYDSAKALWGNPGATTGYTAHGWATSPWQGSASLGFGQAVTQLAQSGNVDLYVAETPNQYSVALDAAFPAFANGDVYAGYGPNGVSKDAGTTSVTATFDAGMPAATMPRATGYRFEGYFDDAGTCYYNADGSSARTWDKPGAATLHARWSVERHELTLDVGNGEVPSAAGRGWVRDAGGSGLYRLSYSIEWVEESGGSLRITLPAPAIKPGYSTFDGWAWEGTSKPSARVQVQPWELVDRAYVGAFSGAAAYVAALDLAGGSFPDAPEGWTGSGGSWLRGFTVESDAFELPTPTRAGHDFQGWALVAPDGSLGSPAASVTVPKGTVGDRSYRAVWQARAYAITWHYSGQSIGGQQSATSSQAYGQAIAFPSRPSVADPAREHYDFEGWFTEREGGERVEAGDYLVESDSTFYARWKPVEYTVHLHLGDDDAYGEHRASIEQGGQALPLAPDGHFDVRYTVEDEVRLPMVTDDPAVPKPVREGMSFVGWVGCTADGVTHPGLVPEPDLVLPAGSHGEKHFRAVWSFALRFEVPSAVSFRFDLADDPAFADAPYGPVHVVSGDGVEMRSLSLGQLAVADVAVDVEGARPDDVVTDRSKVMLRVRDASLPEPWSAGWAPLPRFAGSPPEQVDPFELADIGFGDANPVAPLSSKPLKYEIELQEPAATLAGEVDAPLARIVFTVKGLW